MDETRRETDSLGSMDLPAQALAGIHAQRARGNFDLAGRPLPLALWRAYGWVKLACARVNQRLHPWDEPVADAVMRACQDLIDGHFDAEADGDAWQGGAGTSTNMLVNEVLTNAALRQLGHAPGSYHILHPNDDLNRHQSTNDTYPTALKVAILQQLPALEQAVTTLVDACQERERSLADIVAIGRTEGQDAVLTTVGRKCGAWAESFARDRWRIAKCVERVRVVNLGGTAIGTGLGAPRQYIFQVVDELRALTGLHLARAENLVEATQNVDALVEVGGYLKVLATNLLKVSGDLRFLSSGPDAGLGELHLPPRQAGSSIMPGKINPVIPEAVSQAALMVIARDQALATAAGLGQCELNAFLPLIADILLDDLAVLRRSCIALAERCIAGIEADGDRCASQVANSTATLTALVEPLGYARTQQLVAEARASGEDLRTCALRLGWLDAATFDALIAPDAVNRLGSR